MAALGWCFKCHHPESNDFAPVHRLRRAHSILAVVSLLESTSRARVAVNLERLEEGNLSNVKDVGGSVMELRMDIGPGFRAYLGRDGETLLMLLGGGNKKSQQNDIAVAQRLWSGYKAPKKEL